ncbi:nickel-binding protein [Vibrio sp. TRT 1302]|uniref:nickel-binding protein n=1 Tax=Vibrio sp. TRT 1302 TaxID=3418504 RepID=UPI003CF02A57
MPLFMDRHFSENPTREAIELAHRKDLDIQEKYGVKFVTYWFDETRGTTFCLVEAESESIIRKVHQEAHGDIPGEIIPVDRDIVKLFLGRIEDPITTEQDEQAQIDSAFRIIMFTDLAGSTAMTTKLGDQKSMHLLRIHNAITRNAIKMHNGREVKHTGDGFMVSFTSADDAVRCAKSIQQAFKEHNTTRPDQSMHVRIGLSAGEPVEENNDLFGTAVQMASRVCDATESDQILVVDLVRQSCSDPELLFHEFGERLFKGFNEPTRVYQVS